MAETTEYKLSPPLLIDPPSEYFDSKHRLLIVGQETYGWFWDSHVLVQTHDHVEALMSQYRGFDLGANYHSTPFWRASHRLNKVLNGDGNSKFLWANLVRTDEMYLDEQGSKKYRRPPEGVEEDLCSFSLLQREIEILEPDVVAFFTGPHYDERLKKSFVDGVRLVGISDLKVMGKVSHSTLPKASYRCYHPDYLRRQGLTEKYLSFIASYALATFG